MHIICNRCKAEIHPRQETVQDGEIIYSFFRCPECGAVYPVAVTDVPLRKDIEAYVRMNKLVEVKRPTEQFLREAGELKQRNIKRCRELMEQYPLAPLLTAETAE